MSYITLKHPILLLLVVSISSAAARELRPSEHGLGNQTDPPSSSTDQMKSFFSCTPPGPDLVALPKPTDSSDPDWWKKGQDEPRRKERGGLVKKILLITSIVCGVAGAAFLLAAAAVVFAFRFRTNGGSNNEAAGPSRSTQLVVK